MTHKKSQTTSIVVKMRKFATRIYNIGLKNIVCKMFML